MAYLDDLFSVTGKKALVTGAATGIGRMVATALVHGGADVMIASRKGADCKRIAGELNAVGAPPAMRKASQPMSVPSPVSPHSSPR
jgi:NAD(P)-dependent dehydrogenase (short-subunit alcohol dehydrogenase family)